MRKRRLPWSAPGPASADAPPPSPAVALRRSLRAFRRASSSLLLQQTAAAAAAWLVATEVVAHEEPFFAPIAAVVSLNAPAGERGSNVLRMLLGVIVGIFVGEVTIALLGAGYGRLAVATFTAMAVARALDGARIVIAQAAASAILTVVVLDGAEAGIDRLIDAFIGGGVALVFTQVLFSPEPVRLVRRAEAAGLAAIAEILELTAQALEHDDVELAARAVRGMHELRSRLVDLHRVARQGVRVRRHSVVWRSQARARAVLRETEHARHLDLLGGSCLMLARTAAAASPPERHALAPRVRALAEAITDLAEHFDDRDAPRRAGERARALAPTLISGDGRPPAPGPASLLLEVAAADFMVFVGVDPAPAHARAVRV